MLTSPNWATFKTFVTNYGVSIQWMDLGTLYYLIAYQGRFEVEYYMLKSSPASADQTDFETNYKPNGNQSIPSESVIQAQPPYGAKTVTVSGVSHKLYARSTGIQQALSAGSNTITYTMTYPWAKIIGLEIIGCESLDVASLSVYDTSAGTYSGTPNALLQQFGFSVNLPADFYQRMSQFDADIYQGMVVSITYVSKSAKTVGVNFLLDQVI